MFLQLLSCRAHLHAELAQVDDVWPLAVLPLGPQLLAVLWAFRLLFNLSRALCLGQGLGLARQLGHAEAHLPREHGDSLARLPGSGHL